MKKYLIAAAVLSFVACKDDKKETSTSNPQQQTVASNKYKDEYPEVPEGSQLLSDDSLTAELEQKYTADLSALQSTINANHSKMILLLVTPEVGVSASQASKK